ncbi:hypothetical protein EPO05_02945, partial [Patescibacteria group bacterium]
MQPFRNILSTSNPWIIALITGSLGFFANQFPLGILGGSQIVAGGVFTLIVAVYHGVLPGVLAAAIAFSRCYLLWGDWTALILYSAEAAFVSHWSSKRQAPLIGDCLFWGF